MGLLSLPYELVAHISTYLSIPDCVRLQYVNKSNRFTELLADRINLDAHFHSLIPQPTQLLPVLRSTNVVLVHERALQYFFPSLAIQTSTWTFVAPACARQQVEFMKFMEAQGVVWETCVDIFKAKVQARESFVIPRKVFLKATQSSHNDELEMKRREIVDIPWPFVMLSMDEGSWTFHVCDRDELDTHAERRWETLKGKLNYGGKVRHVEMLYDKKGEQDMTGYLLQLPESVEQCFVGGFGASHLYGRLTDGNAVRIWSANRPQAFERAVQPRGLVEARIDAVASKHRHSFDRGCLLVDGSSPQQELEEHRSSASREALCFDWEEVGDSIKHSEVRWSRSLFRRRRSQNPVDYEYLLCHGMDRKQNT